MKYSFAILAAAAAVNAAPAPQGVTAIIAPSAPAPSACMTNYAGTFGIVVQNVTAATGAVATQSADGQPAAGSSAPVSTISDHQPQATTGPAPVSTISDHQPQAPSSTAAAASQISDGQVQGPTGIAVSQISDGQVQGPTGIAVSQISDGQVQGPTATAVSTISDHQPQAPSGTAVSTISDHQPQAPSATAASTISDHQPQAPSASASSSAGSSSGSGMVACKSDSTLTMTLSNGQLKDNAGRTGYIASNFQFQFDGPPQAGAIYTSGFSVCGNGSLALGGSTTFYQCLSGSFYNLYNENWAAQCNAVTINAVQLVDC